MNAQTFAGTALALLLAGCAGRSPQPVFGPESPTSTLAPEAPLPPRSETLAIAEDSLPPGVDEPPMPGTGHAHGHHGHGTPDATPPKTPDANAPESAPRTTPETRPATQPLSPHGAHGAHDQEGGER